LLKYIDTSERGIEVAPYFNPTLRKSDGHPVLILDVFDTNTLRKHAREDPLIKPERINEIEEVDIVGDASAISELVRGRYDLGSFHYVLSSHNFEHLPNPISFLQGCSEILAPGGMLSLVVPDCRASFDFYRFPTRLSDWLDAFHENRNCPSPATVFDGISNKSKFQGLTGCQPGCVLGRDDPSGFIPDHNIGEAYKLYLEHRKGGLPYRDAHVSVFFPETLELMLRDLRYLGLIDFDVIEITQTVGLEFFVHLRKPFDATAQSDEEFYAQRADILKKISRRLGSAPYGQDEFTSIKPKMPVTKRAETTAKRILINLLGRERFMRLRAWHQETVKGRRP
jgi:SAM-dependent methyltransferase